MALEAKDRPQTMEEWLNLLSFSQAGSYFVEIESIKVKVLILASDVGVDYQNLENLLKAGQWKAADEETTKVMLKAAKREQQGWLDEKSIEKFPCTDLRTIDQLWVKYSNGHFGFSVQKRIWLECGGKVDYETECLLGDRLGWRNNYGWLYKDEHNYSLDSTQGHLPTIPGNINIKGRYPVGSFFSRVQTCKL
ncbi:MAG: GUN4 domain-containing protein [Nostoc sp. NOS(2021)]|uniref:GUN4 domain-containing protein n=1 Tax=Nostoc sp. NOS(2021) TaxID=2815407 RepID=UPI0025FCBF4A|nr:GUN4 domain-containing protein [Nostoc sp. NOS(2021)]MBN3896003.1 GUN4 domain-containing protein [Nostoc sp. NOS(2021)]